MDVVGPDDAGIQAAASALRKGKPVVIPTDTVYGLAALASDAAAVDRLFELKQRPADRSIAVLVAHRKQAETIAVFAAAERRIVEQLWPGALTLVVRRRDDAPSHIGRVDGTVGVRSPGLAVVRALAEQVGPLATTSANRSGCETPAEAVAAAADLAGPVAVVIDAGRCVGTPSTVARVDDHGIIAVLREGSVEHGAISAAAMGGISSTWD